MGMIGNAPVAGIISGGNVQDGSITNADLAAGVAVANLGYTPVNKAGDTMTGDLNLQTPLKYNTKLYGMPLSVRCKTFTLPGVPTTFYPVIFTSNTTYNIDGWNAQLNFEIFRDDVHESGSGYGSFRLTVFGQGSSWGHRSNKIQSINYIPSGGTYGNAVGDVQTGHNNENHIIVWLRGGMAYHYQSLDNLTYVEPNFNPSGGSYTLGYTVANTLSAQSAMMAALPYNNGSGTYFGGNSYTAGYILAPAQPSFMVRRSAVTGIVDPIIWDQVGSNIGNCYNSSTGRFTAPIAGRYSFSLNCMSTGSNATLYMVYGGQTFYLNIPSGSTTGCASIIISLAANDSAYVRVAGGQINSSNGDNNAWSGMLIG